MFRKRALFLAMLVGVLGNTGISFGAEPPVLPGTREAFEADLTRYLPYFRGLLGSDLRTVAPEGAMSRWTFRLTADGTYTDNAELSDTRNGGFSSDASLGVSWLRRSPRLDASLDGRYTLPLYRTGGLEGTDRQTYSLAGAGRWQASPHLSFSAGADVDHNVQSGMRDSPEGVPTDYENRFDNYTAHAEYLWRAFEPLTTTGSYRFRYRNYREGEAEGEDTRAHDASLDLQYRPMPFDTFVLGYAYGLEETPANAAAGLPEGEERTNHKLNASWAHQFHLFSDDRLKTGRIAYALDRGSYLSGDDYWFHRGTISLASPLSARTDLTTTLGLEWYLPDQGDSETGWTGGADLTHRFTAYTTGGIAVSKAWEYAPVSSKTERTTLTDVLRVAVNVKSQLTRYWQGIVSGGYESGEPVGSSGDAEPAREYWAANGSGTLVLRLGEKSFAAADVRVSRRYTKGADDTYWLYGGGLSYHTQLLEWLSGKLGYTYERRDTDSNSALENYRENLLYAALTVEW